MWSKIFMVHLSSSEMLLPRTHQSSMLYPRKSCLFCRYLLLGCIFITGPIKIGVFTRKPPGLIYGPGCLVCSISFLSIRYIVARIKRFGTTVDHSILILSSGHDVCGADGGPQCAKCARKSDGYSAGFQGLGFFRHSAKGLYGSKMPGSD